MIVGAGFYAYGLTHILWLRYVWHYSLLDAGLAVAPGALTAAVAAAVLGRLAERHGHRPVVAIGAVVWALALAWYATRVGVQPDFLGEWLPGQIISGIGVGATLPIVASAALVGIPGGRYAAASAAVSSTRQFGAVLGIAILVAIVGSPTAASAATVFRHGWTFSAACFAIGAVLALFLGSTRALDPYSDISNGSDRREAATVGAPAPAEEVVVAQRRGWNDGFFALLPEQGRFALGAALHTVGLAAGEFLFRQGNASDGMYVVRAGQLEVLIDDVVVSRLGAGDVIGELALLTGAPRSASVRARRDTRLEFLSPDAFDQLVHSEPSIALALARSVAGQLQRLSPPQAAHARPRVIAVVAADPAAPVRAVSAALVRGLGAHLRVIDPGVVNASGLDRAEATHERVVLTAPYDEPDWRDFCLRSADRVVVVAGSSEPPSTRLAGLNHDCDLLMTAPNVGRSELLAWHELLTPVSAHHLGSGQDLDIGVRALCARLARRAVGLVFAGGGARSFAQLGVLEELERAGVIVDRVAGTSAGAVLGGLFATGMSAAEVDAVVYEEFVRRNPLGDYTLPRHGLIRGERTVAAVRRHVGDLIFEELPREFHTLTLPIQVA